MVRALAAILPLAVFGSAALSPWRSTETLAWQRARVADPPVLSTRADVLRLATDWLGEPVSEDHHPTITLVTSTDGRWPFSSLVSETDPAWLVELDGFSLYVGHGCCGKPLNLRVLLRQRDGALLGIRSRWPHEHLGIDLEEWPEPDLRESGRLDSTPRGVRPSEHASTLTDILEAGRAAGADYISAFIAFPSDIGYGKTYSMGRTLPIWILEAARLDDKPVIPRSIVAPARPYKNPRRIVGTSRCAVLDGLNELTVTGNGLSARVTIITPDGDVEQRNWYDDEHPAPFGLAKPQAGK